MSFSSKISQWLIRSPSAVNKLTYRGEVPRIELGEGGVEVVEFEHNARVCHTENSRSSSRPRPTNGPGPASTAGRFGRSMGASMMSG